MPTLIEQLNKLADISFPPISIYEQQTLAAYRLDLERYRRRFIDKNPEDIATIAMGAVGISKSIRRYTVDVEKLKKLFIDGVMAMRKGKDLRIGNGFVSFALPAITLTERQANGETLTECLDDLRITFRFANRILSQILVKTTDSREYPHPSVSHDGTFRIPEVVGVLAGQLDLAGIYDQIVNYLKLGNASSCYLRNLRGRLCNHCNQRGGMARSARTLGGQIQEACTKCTALCRCGVAWLGSDGAVTGTVCPACRPATCVTCGVLYRGHCSRCTMRCAFCRKQLPKSGTTWFAGSWSGDWGGAWTVSDQCVHAPLNGGAHIIAVDFNRYPHLLQTPNLTGEQIYRAYPEAPLVVPTRPQTPF